jgi:hypothetical protein
MFYEPITKPKLSIKIPSNSFREEVSMPLFISEEKYPGTFNNLHRHIHYLFDKLFTCEITWSELCTNTYRRLLNEFEQEEQMEQNNYYLITKQSFFTDTQTLEQSFYLFVYYIDCYYQNKIKIQEIQEQQENKKRNKKRKLY